MKILIFTASTGGGHKRAAAAMEKKIRSLSPDTNVRVVDAMKSIGRFYDKTVCDGYHFMATKIPEVYGICYKITDRKTLMYKAVTHTNALVSDKLLKEIKSFEPDVLIICHPFVTNMVSRLKRKGKTDVKAISVITDYDAHRTYIGPYIDAYVVAEPEMCDKLVNSYDVDRGRIYPYGIPIFDRFTAPYSKEEICKRENLSPTLSTVLLMAGSFGVTDVLDFYTELAQKGRNIQLIVITGRNECLYEKLQKKIIRLGAQDRTKLLYFVDNVEDYMHISDIIVTKPGGLTVTESLACRLPLAIYSAFPGQERDNADFLVNSNAAVMLDKSSGADTIIGLLSSGERLLQMRKSAEALHIPDSAKNIFELAKKLCSTK